jgi:hypothetical protein
MSKRILDEVLVRPLRPQERGRFERLMAAHHYLGWGQPVGETLLYVAQAHGRWVALLAFGAAAYALRDRDAWIGWSLAQRQARLNFVAQNRRFLILPGVREPNLASRILSLCVRRLASDWQDAYGHPVLLAETFVDPQRFEGTCYLAAGWQPLGLTAGARRVRRDFYDDSGTPKQLLVKALRADAGAQLGATTWPEPWRRHERPVLAASPLQGREPYSLFQAFQQVPEFRGAHGRRHLLAAVLACATCALLAGAEGIGEMAEIVGGFDQRELRLLRCWRNRRNQRYVPPSENTLRRVLGGIDPTRFDRIVGDWVRAHGRVAALAIDGKTLKACLDAEGRQTTLVAAVAHGDGAPLAQLPVPPGTNETATARDLLDALPPLDGALSTFDAAHTNAETACKVVRDKGGDYLLPIKGNQPTLLDHANRLLPQAAFSPCGVHGRERARPGRNP